MDDGVDINAMLDLRHHTMSSNFDPFKEMFISGVRMMQHEFYHVNLDRVPTTDDDDARCWREQHDVLESIFVCWIRNSNIYLYSTFSLRCMVSAW